ncbi:hypothetical protein STRDD11_01060 [Streptococcus sp. DD11]|nr:hypothetical protein STRDD11_01060 [Streptococcus sp. DD11]
MEKANGGAKCSPDEQRKYLETFEERVIADCSVEEANSSLIRSHFKEMLVKIIEDYSPVTVKISPQVESSNQIFYLKTAKELGCQASIVSADCQASPFGLVIHSDQPVEVDEKEMLRHFAGLLHTEEKAALQQKKPSFWEKLFK